MNLAYDNGNTVKIEYTSQLSVDYLHELEQLMYFNPGQHNVEDGIMESIRRYGKPQIINKGDMLYITVAGVREVQTIYALAKPRLGHQKLVGLAVFTREDIKSIMLLHVSVKPAFSQKGRYAGHQLTLGLFEQLKRIASRIKGVQELHLIYGRGIIHRVPV